MYIVLKCQQSQHIGVLRMECVDSGKLIAEDGMSMENAKSWAMFICGKMKRIKSPWWKAMMINDGDK